MPTRAHFVTYLTDVEGRPISGASVEVRVADTETLISETIFAADDPDTTELTNPFTADADGKCEFFLAIPDVVDLYVTKTGYDPGTIRATVHQLTAATLTLLEAGTPLAQRAGINFLAGFDLTDDAANDETEVAIDLSELSVFTDHSARHEDGGADEISLTGLAGTPTDLQTHLDDAADAHDASAISVADAGGLLAATDVEAALAEIQGALNTDEAGLASHLSDAADAHDASAISVADAGGLLAATDVEAALAEIQGALNTDEAALAAHLADASDAHDASAISYAGGSGITAGSVESAIDELDLEKAAASHDFAAHVHAGAVIWLDTNYSVSNNSDQLLGSVASEWTEDFDTDGIYSGVSVTRLAIPAALDQKRVRFTAKVQWAGAAGGFRRIMIRRNTDAADVGTHQMFGENTVQDQQVVTPPIVVDSGDFFTLNVHQNSGGALTINAGQFKTFFELEVLGD